MNVFVLSYLFCIREDCLIPIRKASYLAPILFFISASKKIAVVICSIFVLTLKSFAVTYGKYICKYIDQGLYMIIKKGGKWKILSTPSWGEIFLSFQTKRKYNYFLNFSDHSIKRLNRLTAEWSSGLTYNKGSLVCRVSEPARQQPSVVSLTKRIYPNCLVHMYMLISGTDSRVIKASVTISLV